MDIGSIRGSIQLPVFFLVWSAGVGWFSAQIHDSTPAAGSAREWVGAELVPVPDLADPMTLNGDLKTALLQASEVMSGRWNPSPSQSSGKTASDPKTDQPSAVLRTAAVLAALQSFARRETVSVSVKVPDQIPFMVSERIPESTHRPALETASAPARIVVAEPPRAVAQQDTSGFAANLTAVAHPAAAVAPVMRIVRKPVAAPDARHETLKANARVLLATATAADAGSAYQLLLDELDSLAADDREYLGMMAVAALASGRYGEARLTYVHLLQRDPQNSRWWAGRAIAEEQIGERETSRLAFLQVTRLSQLDSVLGRFARQRAGSGSAA